jgi:hypothetical protein
MRFVPAEWGTESPDSGRIGSALSPSDRTNNDLADTLTSGAKAPRGIRAAGLPLTLDEKTLPCPQSACARKGLLRFPLQ